ncbi:GNAT family N-acetyltransferase [Egbenema bharatensis]|uniref:GNAT family N-acetyltransferase n=1 Tax=Egbenema bharatensis TaxID=3463334 RepID=UPI003A839128
MATLTMRPYQGETDLQPIVNLLNTCEAIDREDIYYTVSSLKLELTSPNLRPELDVKLWYNDADQLIGFGQIWLPDPMVDEVDAYLWFRVHPTLRHQGLEQDIITWAEGRTWQVGQEQNLPAKLSLSCRDYQRNQIGLFEATGFTWERSFFRMKRSLTEPIPEPIFPKGYTLLTGQEFEVSAWVEMHNQTFIDHWNFHPMTLEQANHWLSDPTYRPDLDLVAVAPDGTYAAFCHNHIDPEENQHRKCLEGWVGMLGTRRGYRRLGLGRAMLLSGLHRLQAAGMDTAFLGVDSQNPNQAYSLYESVGFRRVYSSFCYSKAIE